jgi:hypothetical protein
MKELRCCHLLVALCEKELTPMHRAAIKGFMQSGEKLGITPRVHYGVDTHEIDGYIRQHNSSMDGFFSLPHFMRTGLITEVANLCLEAGVVFCAPSLDAVAHAPIVCGFTDEMIAAPEEFCSHSTQDGCAYGTITARRAYETRYNRELVGMLGGKVPDSVVVPA